MLVEIVVDEEVIRAGVQLHGSECPVAKAFHKVLKEENEITTLSWVTLIDKKNSGESTSILHPESVQQSIAAYDRDEGMHPFSFEVEIPDHLLKEEVLCLNAK
jgi:hypothetical protein